MVRKGTIDAADEECGGLTVTGKIIARTTKQWPDKAVPGTLRTCVTYRILAGIEIVFVDEWCAEATAMPVGSRVSALPVYVRAYVTGRGSAGYRLCVEEEKVPFQPPSEAQNTAG